MLLTIHNLPQHTQYYDIKELVKSKCGLKELILDNLENEGNCMRVTVGVAEEEDAAILVRKINGIYFRGQQLYVEDKRQKKESEQPYRTSMSQQAQYMMQQSPVLPGYDNNQQMQANMAMFQPVGNYSVYQPQPMDQNTQNNFMAYGGHQAQQLIAFNEFTQQPFAQLAQQIPNLENMYTRRSRSPRQNQPWEGPGRSEDGQAGRDERRRFNSPPGAAAWASPQRPDNRVPRPERPQRARGFDQQQDMYEEQAPRNRDNMRGNDARDSRGGHSSNQRDARGGHSFNPRDTRGGHSFNPRDTRGGHSFNPRDTRGGHSFNPRDTRGGNSFNPRDARGGHSFNPRDTRGGHSSGSRNVPNNSVSSSRDVRDFNDRDARNLSPHVRDQVTNGKKRRWDDSPATSSRTSGAPAPRQSRPLTREPYEPRQKKFAPDVARSAPKKPAQTPAIPRKKLEFILQKGIGKLIFVVANNLKIVSEIAAPSPTKSLLRKALTDRVTAVVGKQCLEPDEIVARYRARFPESEDFQLYSLIKKTLADAGPVLKMNPKKLILKTNVCPILPEKIPSCPQAASGAGPSANIKLKKEPLNTNVRPISPGKTPNYSQAGTGAGPSANINPKKEPPNTNTRPVSTGKTPNYPQGGSGAGPSANVIAQKEPLNTNARPFSTGKTPNNPQGVSGAAPSANINPKKKKPVKKHVILPGKIPSYPLGDKKIQSQQKQQHKKDMETLETCPVNMICENAIEAEAKLIEARIKKVFNNPDSQSDKQIIAGVDIAECINQCKKLVMFHVSRRITDCGLKLLRITGRPKAPKRADLELFLTNFGCLSLKKSVKSVFYSASFYSYETMDMLCSMSPVPMGNPITLVTFKPMHVAPKSKKIDYEHARRVRMRYITSLIDKSNVNLLDKDWMAQEEAEKKANTEIESDDVTPTENNSTEITEDKEETAASDEIVIKEDETEPAAEPSETNEDVPNVDLKVIDEVKESETDEIAHNTPEQGEGVREEWNEAGDDWSDVGAGNGGGDGSNENNEKAEDGENNGNDDDGKNGGNDVDGENDGHNDDGKNGGDDVDGENESHGVDGENDGHDVNGENDGNDGGENGNDGDGKNDGNDDDGENDDNDEEHHGVDTGDIDIADVDFDDVDENDLEDY